MDLIAFKPPRAGAIEDEDPTAYEEGDFYPVRVGEVFGGNYKIIRKLGCGGYSTVWLAEDTRCKISSTSLIARSGQAVALKVMRLSAPRYELDISNRLQSFRGTPASEYVVQTLDFFDHPGPNGAHLCIVMELMWQDVCTFLNGYYQDGEERFPLIKEISRKCLECLSALHECGIIHNGNRSCSRIFC
jgi:serine/threonine-protein kinase SRPK3